MATDLELVRRIKEVVRAYRAEKGCTSPPKDLFIELEDDACEMGDSLAQALLEDVLRDQAREAEAADQAPCCPRCQSPGRSKEPEPRRLQTRRGEVGWKEPEYYCRKCRQAFFPSVPPTGHQPE